MSIKDQIVEKKLFGCPYYVYGNNSWVCEKIAGDVGVTPLDVNKKWVTDQIKSTIDSVLVMVDMNSVSEIVFAYNKRLQTIRTSNRTRKIDGTTSS